MERNPKAPRAQRNQLPGAYAQKIAGISRANLLASGGAADQDMNRIQRQRKQRGFSVLELLVVMAMAIILGVIGFMGFQSTSNYLKISGDLRDINGMVAQAKMSAAANFTHARAYADLNANTFHQEIWIKNPPAPAPAAGCWQTVGDPANVCTVAGNSPVVNLSVGSTFGFGNVGAPPANTQGAIGQAAACGDGKGGTIANTACIVFNSRGIPIDAAGNPTGADAFYFNNGSSVYGVTVSAVGTIADWSTINKAGNPTWHHQ